MNKSKRYLYYLITADSHMINFKVHKLNYNEVMDLYMKMAKVCASNHYLFYIYDSNYNIVCMINRTLQKCNFK